MTTTDQITTPRVATTTDPSTDAVSAMRQTPFDLIGGHPTIRAIVGRFYDLMDSDPAYAALRALHAPDLAPMRESLAGFLAAWSGGPRDWFEANPGKCMMSAHRNMAITHELAGQWSEAIRRAVHDTDEAGIEGDPMILREMGDVLTRLAMGMVRGG